MTMNKEKTQDLDILDDIKQAEKAMKAQLLMKGIKRLKVLAKNILETKEECRMLLEEIGISEEDAKRVIDFVNELPETKLKDEDRLRIRADVRQRIKTMRDEVEKKTPDQFVYASLAPHNYKNYNGLADNYTTCSADNTVTCSTAGGQTTMLSSDGKNLSLKL